MLEIGSKGFGITGSWGAILTMIGIILLFVFGDPTTLDMGFENGVTMFTVLFLGLYVINKSFMNMAGNIVIPMTADCADYEVYRSGRYVPGLIGTPYLALIKSYHFCKQYCVCTNYDDWICRYSTTAWW